MQQTQASTEPARVVAALHAGAADVVSKTISAEQLVYAIQQVHAGQQVIHDLDPGRTGKVGRWPGDHIGESLYLGTNTVKSHIRTAYRKIDAGTRSQAVIRGISNGFQSQTVRCYPTRINTSER